MKKILFLLSFLAFSLIGMCQSFSHTTANPTGAILNGSADTMNYVTGRSYTSVGIQPVITKASGTMAGKTYLWVSLNGINYVLSDSVTNTDATINTTIWVKSNPVYNYWRIITNGATTVTGSTSAYFTGKIPK